MIELNYRNRRYTMKGTENNHLPYKNEPKQVNIRIGITEYEKLETSCKKMGLSKSEYLMKLINENYEG